MKVPQHHIDDHKNTDWTYRDIARSVGIDPNKFEELMVKRFENPEENKEGTTHHLRYTLEWALRVRKDWHFDAADHRTREVLQEIGYREPEVKA